MMRIGLLRVEFRLVNPELRQRFSDTRSVDHIAVTPRYHSNAMCLSSLSHFSYRYGVIWPLTIL